MKIKKDLISREIAGERFLVPVGQSVYGTNGLLLLTEVGGFIWDLLPTAQDPSEIVQAILREYDVDEATATADVMSFLTKLESMDIL